MEKPEQHTIYKTKESLLVGGVFFLNQNYTQSTRQKQYFNSNFKLK